jgi:hypothetical protein
MQYTIHKDETRVSCMNYLNVGMFRNVTDIMDTRISISLNGPED